MTLKECTKEELLIVIKRLTILDRSHLDRVLIDLEYERVKRKIASAERWAEISDACRKRYVEIMKKHEGEKLTDIPISEIKEADECIRNANKADKEYDKLMKEVDAYGT